MTKGNQTQNRNNHNGRSTVQEQLRSVQTQVPRHKLHALRPLHNIGEDGEGHINIYDMGATNLGKALVNSTSLNFVHPEFGPFESVEGFVGYLLSGNQDPRTRRLSGRSARDYVKEMNQKFQTKFQDLRVEIAVANMHKLEAWPQLLEELIQSEMPFDNYYIETQGNGSGSGMRIRPKHAMWLVPMWSEIRNAIADNRLADFDFLYDSEFDKIKTAMSNSSRRDNRDLRSVYSTPVKSSALETPKPVLAPVRTRPEPLTVEKIHEIIDKMSEERTKVRADKDHGRNKKKEGQSDNNPNGKKRGNNTAPDKAVKEEITGQLSMAGKEAETDGIDPRASHQAKFNGQTVDMLHPSLSRASLDEIEGHHSMAALDQVQHDEHGTAVIDPGVDLTGSVITEIATGQVVVPPADGSLIVGQASNSGETVSVTGLMLASKHQVSPDRDSLDNIVAIAAGLVPASFSITGSDQSAFILADNTGVKPIASEEGGGEKPAVEIESYAGM